MPLHRTFFKLSLPLFVILIAGCSLARYGNVQRAESKTAIRMQVERKTEMPGSAIIQSKIKSSEVDKSGKQQTTSIRNEIKDDAIKLPSGKKALNYSIIRQTIASPDDSIEIDIKDETRKAEKYGTIGFFMGLLGWLGLLLFPPVVVGGLIFSILAFYKMQAYELDVKNRTQIVAGLILNIVWLALLILLIAVIIALL